MQSKYDNAFTVLCESLIETGHKEDRQNNKSRQWITLADNITQVLQSFIFSALKSARLIGDPSIMEIFGKFFSKYHSLHNEIVMIGNIIYLCWSMFTFSRIPNFRGSQHVLGHYSLGWRLSKASISSWCKKKVEKSLASCEK